MSFYKKVSQAIKNKYNFHRSRPLPQTEAEVRALAEDVCRLGNFPENDSFLHAVSSQLMHMDSGAASCRVRDFVQSMRRSICNQAAFAMIEETKGRKASEKSIKATPA